MSAKYLSPKILIYASLISSAFCPCGAPVDHQTISACIKVHSVWITHTHTTPAFLFSRIHKF